jgi:competence protein ComGC
VSSGKEHTGRQSGYGAIETFIVVAVVAVLIFIVVSHYAKNLSESRDTALVAELASLRNTINLFSAVKGRCPETLGDLLTAEYVLPYKAGPTKISRGERGNIEMGEKEIFKPKYLEAYALDKEGNMLDAFGLPYLYDPVKCSVRSQSPGYEDL